MNKFKIPKQSNVSILRHSSGFTIVELLVVIVVIGILASITVVSYSGINQKAISASLQSDLAGASKQLMLFQVKNGTYPITIDCAQSDSSTNKCLKTSNGNSFIYNYDNSANHQVFGLTATKNNISYRINNDSAPIPCPIGYIIVPGNSIYGTGSFCVMKYEAKNVGGKVTSQAALTPLVNTNRTSAVNYATAACSGCHLITEAEWLTIAQNVLSVPTNWSSGVVGSGYVYRGHSDNDPSSALAASADDNNGYYSTNQSSGNQRRTLTLSNGEVIWDLAGNDDEWTMGTSTNNQPGITSGGAAWREWTAVTNPGALSPNPNPTTTGIAGANSWNSSNGIGMVYSNTEETAERAFVRGGSWNGGVIDGVLSLYIVIGPLDSAPFISFRVAR